MDGPKPDPSAVLRCDYEGDLVTLRAARRAVIEWLGGLGADNDTRERGALIVSELASNAIQAAPGRTYSLQLALEDHGSASISVRNHPTGTLPPARDSWRPQPATQVHHLAPRGRGLAIVDSLSEDVTVEQHGHDVVVTARVRIDYSELGPS